MFLSEKEPSLNKVIQTLVLRNAVGPALHSFLASGTNHTASSLRHTLPLLSVFTYFPLPPSAVSPVKTFLSTIGEPYLSITVNMMKALRFHGQRDIRLDDVEIVQCGRDQVKVGAVPNF